VAGRWPRRLAAITDALAARLVELGGTIKTG